MKEVPQKIKDKYNDNIHILMRYYEMEKDIGIGYKLIPIYIKLHWVHEGQSPIIELIKNYKGPKYIVTYENQKHLYKYLEKFNFEILTIDDDETHVSKNRNFIIDHAHQNKYKYVIDLDDDITQFAYGWYGKTVKEGKPMIKLTDIDFETMVIAWLYEAENFDKLKNNWAISGIFNGNRFGNLTDRYLETNVPIGRAIQIFLYNIPIMKKYDIKYSYGHIWEDFDIILQCAKNKMQIPMVRKLYYKSKSMNVETKQVQGNFVFEKNIKFSIGLLNKWSDRYVRLSKSVSKQKHPNCQLRWSNIKKDFGNFIETLFPVEYKWIAYVDNGIYTYDEMVNFVKGNYENQ